METDLSEYHKGTDGLYYADYIAPVTVSPLTKRIWSSPTMVGSESSAGVIS